MSTKSNLVMAFALSLLAISSSSTAMAGEAVQSWVGVIDDYSGSHDPAHDGSHQLKFTRSSDGESFFITEGDDEIRSEHMRTDKSMSVRVDGRITSKFLFFGGNLVVTKLEKLADLNPIEHKRVARLRDAEPTHGRRNR